MINDLLEMNWVPSTTQILSWIYQFYFKCGLGWGIDTVEDGTYIESSNTELKYPKFSGWVLKQEHSHWKRQSEGRAWHIPGKSLKICMGEKKQHSLLEYSSMHILEMSPGIWMRYNGANLWETTCITQTYTYKHICVYIYLRKHLIANRKYSDFEWMFLFEIFVSTSTFQIW